MSPAITVLLPYRDAAKTLARAINSIMDQTFENFEFILIDNGSTDGSNAIAKACQERDNRIKVIQEPTEGVANALNTGLAHAQSNYIARMDADDRAQPERFAKQIAYLEAYPEIGVLGTRTAFISSVEKSEGMQAFVQWQNKIISAKEHYLKRFVDAPVAHPSIMFRKELVTRFGGYNSRPLPEDHELWLRWMHAGVRFAKLPEELLAWIDHDQRLSRTHSNYSIDAFFSTKAKFIASWYRRKFDDDRPIIIAGTSKLCRDRAKQLEAEGLKIAAFTDVKKREIPGYTFIPHDELPGPGKALVISFISQRGTGDRIAEYLSSRGLVEGDDLILAA